MITTDELSSKTLYSVLIDNLYIPPTSQTYFERIYGKQKWEDIYLLPRILTKDTRVQCFQYKTEYSFLKRKISLLQFF